ncbi:hypothetical protein [Clostridium estertheticum]|uniref:hypothetical protein n=1 Tax=Clostridium estertheticum TaxID=238834 RepID=UPI001C6F5A85|nr:hypothetical protein [Clostridium estertheticum]MBW9154748.1 hypothetical protein [Clostridium estertheticum]WLC82513.1 hypothetical protein KTC97_10130 [Clostridium estertheticum]
MDMFRLEPEVAGEIGENSRIRYERGMIKEVEFLHYEFTGWLGDEILTSHPCFIVSENIVEDILRSKLRGYRFEDIEISTSDEFKEMFPNRYIPNFKRLIPLGKVVVRDEKIFQSSEDDFCLEDDVELVVSYNALEILKKSNIDNCEICDLN